MLHVLLELQYSVDVLAEHQLVGRLDEYPVVVIPECHLLPDELVSALLARVMEGGSLLVVGAETTRMFEEDLGTKFKREPDENSNIYIEAGDALAWMGGLWQMTESRSAETIGKGYTSTDTRQGEICAASLDRLGEGRIVGLYGPFGSVYKRSHSSAARRFLGDIMQRLFPSPLLDVDGPASLDVSIRRKSSDLLVHLTNTANKQIAPNHTTIDHIPHVGPIMMELILDREPEEVSIEPGHMPASCDAIGGSLRILIEKLPIHSVVMVRGYFPDT